MTQEELDALMAGGIDDFDDIDFEDKYFPAMAFTVSDGGGKIEFYYTMEWENNEITELPDII